MKSANGVSMLNRQSDKIAATTLPRGNHHTFAFYGDGMRNKTAARPQGRLRCCDHRLGHTAANEDRIGARQVSQGICHIPVHRHKPGNTVTLGIHCGPIKLRLASVDGIGLAARCIPQEID